jgi:phytoene dehydrogenase-like protein
MELADGRVVQARRGVANVNPRMLYLQMLDAGDVAPEIRARMQRYRAGSARFRMNVALSELPHFDGSGPAGNDIPWVRDPHCSIARIHGQRIHRCAQHGHVAGSGDRDTVALANLILDTVSRHAPNFRASIIGILARWSLDLEQRFGFTHGDIFHGALGLDRLWSARPLLGYGDYRTCVSGLYLCGAGAHPGGGLTGLPGRNAPT